MHLLYFCQTRVKLHLALAGQVSCTAPALEMWISWETRPLPTRAEQRPVEIYGFQWNLSRNFAHNGFVAFPEVQDLQYGGSGERHRLCYGIQPLVSRRCTSSHPHPAFSAGLSTGSSESLQTPVGLYLGFPPALWQSMKISTAWLAASPTLYIFFSPCSSTPICQNPHGGPDKDYFFEWGELLAMRLLQLPPISFLDPLCIFLM